MKYNGRRGIRVNDKNSIKHRIRLKIDGDWKWNSVENWIKVNPKLLFQSAYQSKKYGMERIFLGGQAKSILESEMWIREPKVIRHFKFNQKLKRINSLEVIDGSLSCF